MKKLFSLVFALVFVFGLSACINGDDQNGNNDEYDGTITIMIGEDSQEVHEIQYRVLDELSLLALIEEVVEVETLSTEYGPMILSIGSIASDDDGYIAILKNGAYATVGIEDLGYQDGDEFLFIYEAFAPTLIIELYDGYTISTHYVNYDAEAELTLFDILDENFTIGYDETDWGKMLTQINDLEVEFGNFIAMYHNGESMMEGVTFDAFEPNDTFRFALEWWDQEARAHSMIDAFIENYSDAFIESGNYYVIAGLSHLDDVVIDLDLPEFEEGQSAGWYTQWILVGRALGKDTALFEAELATLATLDFPYSAALFSIALEDVTFTSDFIDMVEGKNLSGLDLDTLSMLMLAMNHAGVTEMNDDFLDVIETNLYASSYGDNAATFAHVLMALISAGVDPMDARFNDGEMSFIDVFMSYHMGDGSFKYQLDQSDADMMFTTPQAFLALVMYAEGFHASSVQPFLVE